MVLSWSNDLKVRINKCDFKINILSFIEKKKKKTWNVSYRDDNAGPSRPKRIKIQNNKFLTNEEMLTITYFSFLFYSLFTCHIPACNVAFGEKFDK